MKEGNLHNEGINSDDVRMQKDILLLLQEDPKIDAAKMEVAVKDGKAILKGKADTEEEKHHAENIASSVKGVQVVENHLKVEIGIVHALSALAARLSADDINKQADKKE